VQRQIGIVGEAGDGLLLAVLEDGEVGLRQVGNQSAALLFADGEEHVDQIDVDADGGLRLGMSGGLGGGLGLIARGARVGNGIRGCGRGTLLRGADEVTSEDGGEGNGTTAACHRVVRRKDVRGVVAVTDDCGVLQFLAPAFGRPC